MNIFLKPINETLARFTLLTAAGLMLAGSIFSLIVHEVPLGILFLIPMGGFLGLETEVKTNG